MKKNLAIHFIALGLFIPAFARSADLNADNLTLSASMALGQVTVTGSGTTVTAPGVRFSVSQEMTEETMVSTIYHPPTSYVEETINDEYGWVEGPGEEVPVTEWGIIGSTWVDTVWGDDGYFDEDNIWVSSPYIISEGYSEDVWGDIVTGTQWVSGEPQYQVIGTYTTYNTVEVPGYTETIENTVTGYTSPKIKQAASRSDANWVWQVPTVNNSSSLRDILVLYDGGLSLPSKDPLVNMALLADNLTYSRQEEGADYNATLATRTKADEVELTADRVFSDSASMSDQAKLSAQFLTFKYDYTEANGQPTSKQSRIGAESAYFDGLVTVKGNVNVGGVIRIQPAGNLTMGEFQDGPQPALAYPSEP